MSVVIRCRTSDRRPAVLKVSPERKRLANEAAALGVELAVDGLYAHGLHADARDGEGRGVLAFDAQVECLHSSQ